MPDITEILYTLSFNNSNSLCYILVPVYCVLGHSYKCIYRSGTHQIWTEFDVQSVVSVEQRARIDGTWRVSGP